MSPGMDIKGDVDKAFDKAMEKASITSSNISLLAKLFQMHLRTPAVDSTSAAAAAAVLERRRQPAWLNVYV